MYVFLFMSTVCVFNWPAVGAVSAVHKCTLDVPGVLAEALDGNMIAEMLSLLEKITLLLLGVLYGDQNMEDKGNLNAAVQSMLFLLGFLEM